MNTESIHQRLAHRAWVILVTCLFISSAISGSPAPVSAKAALQTAAIVYDDFNDNYTDPALWSISQAGGPTSSETNQRLEITFPANSAGAGGEYGDMFFSSLWSACQLHGDYDIQVDYQLLTWPPTNGVRVVLSDDRVNLDRASLGQNENNNGAEHEIYWSGTYLNDVGFLIGDIISTSDLSGKLRMQRVDDTINTFYLGDEGWELVASNSDPAYAEDTAFYLESSSGDPIFADQEVKFAFDNLIINHGELVCPPNEAPSVTINQASSQADPTSSSPILFTAAFSEPVIGFGDAATDVTLSGTAGATTATVTETAPNDGTTYTVAVSGMTASGMVIASIPAGAAVNAVNTANAASTSSDNTVTFNLPPTGQITPITATCAQFAAGTASDLDTIKYDIYQRIKNRPGRVSWVSPLSFYYYSKVIAPAANFRIRVVQTANLYAWPFLFPAQSHVYDANCAVVNRRSTVTPFYIDFDVTNATPGAPYYVRIYYLAGTVLGAKVPSPYPAVPYGFTTILNETRLIRSSYDVVYFRP